MNTNIVTGPTDDDIVHLWEKLQADDFEYRNFRDGIQQAIEESFDGKRMAALRKRIKRDETDLFQREVEKIAYEYEERGRAVWRGEKAGLQATLFAIPVHGSRSAITRMCHSRQVGPDLCRLGFETDYLHPDTLAAVFAIPLALEDLANMGPQQLQSVVRNAVTWLRDPGQAEAHDAVIYTLSSLYSAPRKAMSDMTPDLDMNVLVGVQLRVRTADGRLDPGTDGLVEFARGSRMLSYLPKWKEGIRPLARAYGVSFSAPITWVNTRVQMMDEILKIAVAKVVAQTSDANFANVEMSLVLRDDDIDVRVFHAGTYVTTVTLRSEVLSDCMDSFLRRMKARYRFRSQESGAFLH